MQSRVHHLSIAFALCLLAIAPVALGQGLSERISQFRQERMRSEARNTTKGHLLSVLLYRDIASLDVRDRPVRDVLEYLETTLGIPLLVRYVDDRSTVGIDPDAPITLRVESQPALRVIELIMEQVSEFEECTWQLRDGFVELGPKDRLAVPSAQEIRYYPIRDLLFEPPMFDNSPQFDLNQALQQGGGGGRGGGGGGGGGGFGGGGGGGGGSAGGGGGGPPFGAPPEDPERMTEEERAQLIIDLLVETVEPLAWDVMGGTWATIRFYQGTLIVRAPDFVHRQINGYPYRTGPVGSSASAETPRRYVTFTGGLSRIEVIERVRPNIGQRERAGTKTNASEKPEQAPANAPDRNGSSNRMLFP